MDNASHCGNSHEADQPTDCQKHDDNPDYVFHNG